MMHSVSLFSPLPVLILVVLSASHFWTDTICSFSTGKSLCLKLFPDLCPAAGTVSWNGWLVKTQPCLKIFTGPQVSLYYKPVCNCPCFPCLWPTAWIRPLSLLILSPSALGSSSSPLKFICYSVNRRSSVNANLHIMWLDSSVTVSMFSRNCKTTLKGTQVPYPN